MPDANGYFTYSEWQKWAVNKITNIAIGPLRLIDQAGHSEPVDEETREDYLRVQIEAVLQQALRHGRSGRGNDDPVCP